VLVDNPVKAREAASQLRRAELYLIFLYISTYALSSTVLPVVQQTRVPVVVLNLQPVPQRDYEKFNALGDSGLMTGVWLEHCQACSCPEIASVFSRAGISYPLVTGYLQDDEAWKEIRDWVDAAKVAAAMRQNRVGVLGHYYGGMLDVYSDLTLQSAAFGNHFEMLEMCELHALRDPTRGGLATTLNEIASQSGVGMTIDEGAIPVERQVEAACEFLGLDPLYVANEGKLVAIVPAAHADRLLAAMRAHPLGRRSALIGEVTEDAHRFVQMRTRFGGRRIVDWLAGDQLPRIC